MQTTKQLNTYIVLWSKIKKQEPEIYDFLKSKKKDQKKAFLFSLKLGRKKHQNHSDCLSE